MNSEVIISFLAWKLNFIIIIDPQFVERMTIAYCFVEMAARLEKVSGYLRPLIWRAKVFKQSIKACSLIKRTNLR